MTISSINTNLAAISAQQNIENATQAVQNETTALSSGDRIVNASTDVSALAIGTALQSQVNSLTTALTVASQGSSLLQVADGALAQIEAIIQQQQSIATSAQSGSLSDVQRGFLDQEFQQLNDQINQLADSTNFNGVNLINGDIAGGTNVNTNSNAGNADNSIASATVFTAVANGTGTAFASTETLTVNGTTISLADLTGNSATATAANIAAALNTSGSPGLADYQFSNAAGVVTATYTGQATSTGSIPTLSVSTNATSTHITTATGGTATFAVGTAIGTVGILTGTGATDVVILNGISLTAGTTFTVGSTAAITATNLVNYLNSTSNSAWAGVEFVAGASGTIDAFYTGASSPAITLTDLTTAGDIVGGANALALKTQGVTGLGAGAYTAVGTVNGTGLLVGVDSTATDTSTTNFGQAVNVSNVNSNADFIGSFGGTGSIGAITAQYVDSNGGGVVFSAVIGGDTYTTGEITNTSLTGTAPTTLTFTGENTVSGASEGGSFTVTLQGGQTTVSSQNSANSLATAINSGLSGITVYQNRNVLSYNNNFSAGSGTSETATLQGSTLSFNADNFANPLVSSVSVSAPGTGQTAATIELVVGGQTYSTTSSLGDTLDTDSVITLENLSNPAETITLTTGNISNAGVAGTGGTAINLSTASDAAAFQTTLENALGLNNATSALSFQVGTSSADSIGVSIGSATTSALFGGQTLDITTISDASNASNVLTTALNTVIALRSGVGALEERFNYATSAATSAQQNEGAAQSNLLDTDVASESTSFATSQVQLQAGIAVLAQANQLQQNLLKLLG